jgi:hypothetical protein
MFKRNKDLHGYNDVDHDSESYSSFSILDDARTKKRSGCLIVFLIDRESTTIRPSECILQAM